MQSIVVAGRQAMILTLATLATLAILACTSLSGHASASTSDDVMSKREAGRYYMKHACVAQAAAVRFDTKLWRGRDTVSLAEVRRRLDQFRYESERFGKATIRFATKLLNPPGAWPEIVGGLPTKLANANLKRGSHLRRAGDANSAREWAYWYLKARKVDAGNLAPRIRALLNLPPQGEGC